MSKRRILPLMFLLAALMLAACGRRAEETPPEAPSAEDTAPAAEVPELPPDLPEGGGSPDGGGDRTGERGVPAHH